MLNTKLSISAVVASKVTFASHQNSVPVLRELRIINEEPEAVEDLVVEISAEPPILMARRWPIDRIHPGATADIRDLDVALNAGLLLELHEATRADVSVRVWRGDDELACETFQIEALAQNEWGGGVMAELLAAFVMPNDPAVQQVLKDAANVLTNAGKSDALDGYESGSARRVWEVASAIWAAVAARRLTYALPPASFETQGQKIRAPSVVLSAGLATCLDAACLFAAALEQAGLNPLLVLTKGHAFAGVWLQPTPFSDVLTEEAAALRKRVALKELVLFETTLAMNKPAPAFSQAVEAADRQIEEAREADFIQALDIRRARMQRLRPLALRLQSEAAEAAAEAPVSESLEEAPDLPSFAQPISEPEASAGPDRLRAWRRKLLDLTVANRLLNLKPGTTALKLICPDPARLEDRLAAGQKVVIRAAPRLDNGGRDADLHEQRTGERLQEAYAAEALDRDEVLSPLPQKDLETALIELYRKARLDLQEGGANTLFLALGFLRWKREPTDSRSFFAPLILMPINLDRKTARSEVRMTHHDEEARFNLTLLELLRQDFEMRELDAFERGLPKDDSGVDVPAVWAAVRRAVRDMPGFEVVEDVMLGTFSFAKYLMWKDLTDRADQLLENPVVRHLLETPREPYACDSEIPRPETLDEIVSPGDLYTPLPADSSQLAAVLASANGCDFVLDGPPGTGKSQTIANIIAHNLAIGRRVLFVAEKMAALNVVYSRLQARGLGAFCLELHSNKANKAELVRQLGQAWDAAEPSAGAEWRRDTEQLRLLRNELNALVSVLHRPQPGGVTLHQAIGRVVRDGRPDTPVFTWSRDRLPDEALLQRRRDVARRLDLNAGNVIDLDRSAFGWIGEDDWSVGWQGEVLAAASALADAGAALLAALAASTEMLKLSLDDAPETLAALDAFAEVLVKAHGLDLTFAFRPDYAAIAKGTNNALIALASYRAENQQLSVAYAAEACRQVPIEKLTADWAASGKAIWPFSLLAGSKVRKLLATAGGCSSKPDPASDLPRLAVMRALIEDLDGLEASARSVSGWAALKTTPAEVEYALDVSARLLETTARLANSPDGLAVIRGAARALCIDANDLLAEGAPSRRTLDGYRRAYRTYAEARATFAAVAVTPAALGDGAGLGATVEAAKGVLARKTSLNLWCGWVRARREACELDLHPLVDALERGAIGDDGAAPAFEVGHARWLAETLIEREPLLRHFVSVEHEARIADFRALDDAVADLTSRAIRAALAGKAPARDDKRLPKAYAALRHQLTLKAPRKPIRELAQEMGDALTTLTPCLLMSPLSVAQYLPPDGALFDLVIFDEASQITPWDAIGAIARGKQVIVAGDPKQMPPTNFFNRAAGAASDDDSDGVEDMESVLEECLSAGLPRHRLTWHYRSRHESLIAFSNHRYYDGELITFPAPVTRDSAVSFRAVEGVYAKGRGRTNAEEAKALVAEVVRRLRDPAGVDPFGRRLSLGVITLNSEQQRLVEDLLDKERQAHPDIEPFFDEALSEPVVVKNLETVQGDERDIVLLGVGYGPDSPGAKDMSMNFGPLNRDGGWRRWNVAITRARREMVLFASFPPGMIDLNRTRARAVKDLRDYQDFAVRGPKALAQADHGSMGGYESPFEQAVAAGLRDRGWVVATQIGVSRFRIDLAVVHPDRPGDYLAGVECDGASYHSAASARDRDKVRESILRGLGWDLVRVWSTEWWHDPMRALDRLHGQLEERLEASRALAALAPASPDATAEAAAVAASAAGTDPDPIFGESPYAPMLQAAEAESLPFVQDVPLFQDLQGNAATVRYRRADLSSFASVILPDKFYEPSYDPVLLRLTAEIVAIEAPLRDDVLVERIARAHDFQRSGRLIRDRVLQLKGRRFTRLADRAGGTFVWPDAAAKQSWAHGRIPANGQDVRSIEDVCSEELRALARSIEADDIPVEVARRLGVRRLSASARARIEAALEVADA